MAVVGILTNIGIQKSIEVIDNEGFKVYPTDFAVSSTQGTLDPTRTTTNIDEWYRATISGSIKIDNNTVEVSCTVPPSQSLVNLYIKEIYLFGRDSNDIEFLLAIGHPDIDILYNPSGASSFKLQLKLTNADPSELYSWAYTQATEISQHKVDLNAHPDIKKNLQDRILWEHYQKQENNLFLRGGGQITYDEVSGDFIWPEELQVVNPFYGYSRIDSGSLSSVVNEDILYSFIYKPHTFIVDGDAAGIIKLANVDDFSDNDVVLIGDYNSSALVGYVNGSVGSGEDTVQLISFSGIPNAGRWKLDFEGAVSGYLDFNSSAASIKTVLEALPNIDFVTVVGNYVAGFEVTFQGIWANSKAPELVPTQVTLNTTGVAVNVTTSYDSIGYVGKITIDDGLGTPLDLSSFTLSNSAWVMRTNTSLLKGIINEGDLKPNLNGQLDDRILIIGVVQGDTVYLIDGREIRRVWVYEESIISSSLDFDDIVTLPLDSRNYSEIKYYRGGLAELQFYLNGVLQERTPIAVQAPFTPISYNNSTGTVYTGIIDISKVFRGYKFIDGNGDEFFINKMIESGFIIDPIATSLNLVNCSVRRYDYSETGTYLGELKNDIKIKQKIEANNILKFIILPDGRQVAGSGVGGYLTGSNLGSGAGVFKEKLGSLLRFRSISAGSGITVSQAGDEIVISLSSGSVPYWINYITNQTTSLINVGNSFDTGTDKLQVFRNGLSLLLTASIGDPLDRYLEAGITTVTLGVSAVLSDIIAFVNFETAPNYRNIVTSQTSTSISVPSYTTGDDSLLVWRNGLLLNTSGLGNLIDQYTESSSTSIELSSAAEASDVFLIEHLGSLPTFRQDVSGFTGSIIDIGSTYTMGDYKLLVFRNGSFLHNSSTIGLAVDRYVEYSNHEIQVGVAAVSTDVFTFIYV